MFISADVEFLIVAALIIDAFIFGALWQFLTLTKQRKRMIKKSFGSQFSE
jgi:hypothetical protein